MESPFVVYFFLSLFSLAASVIQGVTGFGDAILLQVVWYTATVISPDNFNKTALGDSPVRAVTLLMYCRIVFSAPVLAYMSLRGGVFSLQMTLAMAIPSTLTALIGIFIFRGATSEELKLVLGISGLIFAAMYVVTLGVKWFLRRRKLRSLGAATHDGAAVAATAVTILPETDAVEADLQASRNSSFARGGGGAAGAANTADAAPPSETAAASPAFVSIATGSPFRRREAQPRAVTESGAGVEVPPLTPSKLSPSNTISYTRVRVNRNLDENGKIKLSTKVGASIAALLSGIMGSLTGVGGPPQIIFVLLMDVPQYIMRVNFAMQSIPSAALRFIYACSTGLFTREMIPLFVTSVITGYIGIFLGVKLGKLLGPNSYSIFVLVLLLLSSLVMVTESVAVLVSFTVIVFLITVGSAVYEYRQTAAKVKLQVAMEEELEERRTAEMSGANENGAAIEATARRVTAAPSHTVAAAHPPRSGDTDTPVSFPTPLPRQSTQDATVTPPSPALSNNTREFGRSMNASSSTLADTASASAGGSSSRTSSRIRRAEQRRPPSLFKDIDAPSARVSTKTEHNNAPRGRSMVVSVPAAGDLSGAALQAPKRKASSEKRGLNAEEVKRWVDLQDEEIDGAAPVDAELARFTEK